MNSRTSRLFFSPWHHTRRIPDGGRRHRDTPASIASCEHARSEAAHTTFVSPDSSQHHLIYLIAVPTYLWNRTHAKGGMQRTNGVVQAAGSHRMTKRPNNALSGAFVY